LLAELANYASLFFSSERASDAHNSFAQACVVKEKNIDRNNATRYNNSEEEEEEEGFLKKGGGRRREGRRSPRHSRISIP